MNPVAAQSPRPLPHPRQAGAPGAAPAPAQSLPTALVDRFDANRDRQIDGSELPVDGFAQVDRDRNGGLSHAELAQALAALPPDVAQGLVRSLTHEFDVAARARRGKATAEAVGWGVTIGTIVLGGLAMMSAVPALAIAGAVICGLMGAPAFLAGVAVNMILSHPHEKKGEAAEARIKDALNAAFGQL